MFLIQEFRRTISRTCNSQALTAAAARVASQTPVDPSILTKYKNGYEVKCAVLDVDSTENEDVRVLLLQTTLEDFACAKDLSGSLFSDNLTEQEIYCLVAAVVSYLHYGEEDFYFMNRHFQLLMDGPSKSVVYQWYSPLRPSQASKRFGLGKNAWVRGEKQALASRFCIDPTFIQTILQFVEQEICDFAIFEDSNWLLYRRLFQSLPEDLLRLPTTGFPLSRKSLGAALPDATFLELPSLETIIRWVLSFAEHIFKSKLRFYTMKHGLMVACVGLSRHQRTRSHVPRIRSVDPRNRTWTRSSHYNPDFNPYTGWGRLQLSFVIGENLLNITPVEGASLQTRTGTRDSCLHLVSDPLRDTTTRNATSVKRQVDRLLLESKKSPLRISMVKGPVPNVPSQVMLWVGCWQFTLRLAKVKDDGTYQYLLSGPKQVSRDSVNILWFEAVGGLTLVVTQDGVSVYMDKETVTENTQFNGFFHLARAPRDVYCVDEPARLTFTPFWHPERSLDVGDYKDVQSLRVAFNERFSSFAAHSAISASSTSFAHTEPSESRCPVVRTAGGRAKRKEKLQPY